MGAGADQAKLIFDYSLYQHPIRLNVTVPRASEFASQGMIAVLLFQWNFSQQ
jgi:hypothetical protein